MSKPCDRHAAYGASFSDCAECHAIEIERLTAANDRLGEMVCEQRAKCETLSSEGKIMREALKAIVKGAGDEDNQEAIHYEDILGLAEGAIDLVSGTQRSKEKI